jgi:hypothetical protein
MNAEQVIEMMGVRFNPANFGEAATMIIRFSDLGETHLVGVSNSAIHHQADPSTATIAAADVMISLTKAVLIDLTYHSKNHDGYIDSNDLIVGTGDGAVFQAFIESLDLFLTPRLIEPQAQRR